MGSDVSSPGIPPSDGSVTHFFGKLRAGDRSAADRLWSEYCPRLLGLARKTLGGRRGNMTDAEDAVQSAFISFWRRAEGGEFSGELNRNNLWNLLGVITVRKALDHVEREGAQKRGGGRVGTESSLVDRDGEPLQLDHILGQIPARDFDLHCEELLSQLDDEQRTVALLRLMNYTNREIATICACTERKIERKLQLIRLVWEHEFPARGRNASI
jgi:RNA polymerase sigma factor (sigma-70 family)